ncbi:hypothetical protein [Microbaculum marinum]|uniref:Uncharacterized protein n=1 Tax=Microbaculum marinum TaxID=1764581 RepID=A0AAW9RXA4_9HYPH
MPEERHGLGWWLRSAGPVERVVVATLAAIFVVGVILIAEGLLSQEQIVQSSVSAAPDRLTAAAPDELRQQ